MSSIEELKSDLEAVNAKVDEVTTGIENLVNTVETLKAQASTGLQVTQEDLDGLHTQVVEIAQKLDIAGTKDDELA